GHLAGHAQNAADLLNGLIVAGLVLSLHQQVKAAVPTAEAVEAGGDRDDGKIVLVAAEGTAFGFEHADNGIVDAVDLQAFTHGRSERENIGGEIIAKDTNIAGAVDIDVQQETTIAQNPVAGGKASGSLAEELDSRGGLLV